MTIETVNHAAEQAAAQYQTIVDLLVAVDMDWERYDELLDRAEENRATCRAYAEKMEDWQSNADAAEELSELSEMEDIALAADVTSEDEARERIIENALEVTVRSDWTAPGETLTPSEFCILLCTGGPAVRIVGELNSYGEPCRAWIEYQDWGTPWTQWFDADQDVLVRYASFFYFGA